MLKKKVQIFLVLFLILNTHIFSIHSINFIDNLYNSLSEKGIKSSQKIDILYEIINYHYLSNQYDSMKSAIDEANSFLHQNSDSCLLNAFLLLEAKHAFAEKNNSKAISLANKILVSSQINHCPKTEISTLLFQAKLFLNHENTDISLNKIQIARKLAIAINDEVLIERTHNIESQYEQKKIELIRKLELENAELERRSELRKTRFVAIIAIICTITFIIISLLFYILSRNRKKNNQSLREKNKLIETHSDELEKLVIKLKNITSDLDLANKTKSKLLTIIGHDLRSPFNVIKGYISLLTENDIDPSEREIYYERINNASDQLMEMVDNLLIWTKTQSKKIIPNLTKTDITKIANQSVALLQNNANLKEIQIIADFDNKQSTTIKVDPEMLTRIIHNLLVNAIKFTNKNGQVHLGFIPEKSSMKFWVKDNGVGMNPEDAAAIFENSTDFVKSGTAGEKGTGLGLSICHDFVKYHKGAIWAESELGVGSSFIFTLPIS